MKVAVQDEVVDSEQAMYGNDDSGIEYNPVPAKNKQRKHIDDESDCKVLSEEEYNKQKKKSPKAVVEKSGNGEEQDRVLHTSFNLSPYAINLIGMVKRGGRKKNTELRISSKNKVMLDITSTAIFAFFDVMEEKYIKISDINQLAAEINASSGKVTIIQPKLKIDLGKEEESERIDALILSSVMTRIKMMSEEFGVSLSCIAEFLVYMYVCDSDNPAFEKSKVYCEERMSIFISQLDKFILESTQTNIEDENALIRIGFKMAASNINESTRTNANFKDTYHKTISIDVGSEFNINTKLILRKKNGKRSYDESHTKGIFSGKSDIKHENIGEQDV